MEFLDHLIHTVPIELFVFIGTIIDEVISPIPAFVVLIPAGITAHVQLLPWFYLFVLALISGVARTIAAGFLYIISDKIEDLLFAKGRKFLGTSHKDITHFGKKLNNQAPRKSWIALFVMHAMPVFPGTILSAGSGFIQLKPSIFITATLAGSTVSALFFLYLGYTGLETANILAHLDQTSQIVTVACIVGIIAWIVIYRTRRTKVKK